MARIKEKDRSSVLNALSGGVTPRQGIQFIQVGRADETEAVLNDIKYIAEGGGAARVIQGSFGAGKSFFLTLAKTIALKRALLVMSADFSPDRRLYSSTGQANALYRELIRSLSSMQHPDGGALVELLNAIDEKMFAAPDDETIDYIRANMPYGFDAVTVCMKWHDAKNTDDKHRADANIVKDACMRWFAGEDTREHKKILGVKESIGDDGAYDALKTIAALASYSGYAGLYVEFDECVNLFEINNPTSRKRNYEQILRIFNECLQGDAKHIGFLFGGTPEFVMDPRRGLFSYEALRSRLHQTEHTDANRATDINGPILDLKPLTQEDLLTLLGNITNVQALGKKEDWLVDNDDMIAFLKKHFDTLGAEYYKTPREIIRSFVGLLKLLEDNPEMSAQEAIDMTSVRQTRRESGLGSAVGEAGTNVVEARDTVYEEDDDEPDFGF